MKLMFVSDIHGSLYYTKQMEKLFYEEKADKLILLGDLLYHGPRNDLTKEYNPREVITILNSLKDKISAVRGNCDAEVDQAVLDFPIMAEYTFIDLDDNKKAFITHGHKYNSANLPNSKEIDILIHGHTHIQAIEKNNSFVYINPGSISLPRNGNTSSYMIYENGVFNIKDIHKNIIATYTL